MTCLIWSLTQILLGSAPKPRKPFQQFVQIKFARNMYRQFLLFSRKSAALLSRDESRSSTIRNNGLFFCAVARTFQPATPKRSFHAHSLKRLMEIAI